mmetsp:Transcript_76905/g.168098  ORF Transcript_76905/g.168098 Transcript_76905/m.168098 type:complete len:132 (+) Transcript_76905:1367-1762(+)
MTPWAARPKAEKPAKDMVEVVVLPRSVCGGKVVIGEGAGEVQQQKQQTQQEEQQKQPEKAKRREEDDEEDEEVQEQLEEPSAREGKSILRNENLPMIGMWLGAVSMAISMAMFLMPVLLHYNKGGNEDIEL